MDNTDLLSQLRSDPIFVVGAARSGTTWVHNIMAAHPLVSGIHESWLFTKDSGLAVLFSKAHWPPRNSGLGGFISRETLVAYVREIAQRIMQHALQPEHRYLVEKSPSHLYQMKLIAEIFPQAKFVHVLRDGRDVGVSVLIAANTWMPAWKQSFGRSVKASARAWKDAVNRAQRDGELLGERFFEIRYESLIASPFDSYGRLFDFCGIPYDDATLQLVFEATDFKTNYRENASGFRRRGRTGDWRKQLNVIDALSFDRVAGELLFRLGYETDRRWWLRRLSRV